MTRRMMTLEQLAVGMVIKLPDCWGGHWARLTFVGPVIPGRDSNIRSVRCVLLYGKKADSAHSISLYSGSYEIKPGGS